MRFALMRKHGPTPTAPVAVERRLSAPPPEYITILAGDLVDAALGRVSSPGFVLTANGLRNIAPLKIVGDVNFTNLDLSFAIDLDRCRFDGDVDLAGATARKIALMDCDFQTIRGGSLRVEGDFDLSGSTVAGHVELRNLSVGGDFVLDGVELKGVDEDGVALRAAMAQVRRGLLLETRNRRPFTAHGELRFTAAEVGGLVRFRGAKIDAGRAAVRFDRSKIGGRLFIDGQDTVRTEIKGEVDFTHAELKGGVEILGARFTDLNFSGAKCVGPLIMSQADGLDSIPGAEVPLEVTGELSLINATIEGDWNCDHAIFRVIVARAMKLKGALVHYPTVRIENELDLRAAHVDVMIDSRDAWPKNLKLDLFTYNSFANKFPRNVQAKPASVSDRSSWLRLQPRECRGDALTTQPYLQLAGVLSKGGHRGLAQEVWVALEKLRLKRDRPASAPVLIVLIALGCLACGLPEIADALSVQQLDLVLALLGGGVITALTPIRSGKVTAGEWFGRLILGLTAGYGLKPFRAVYMLLALWAAGACVLERADSLGLIYPSLNRSIPIVGRSVNAAKDPQRGIPSFGAWSYSADLTFPLWNLLQKENFVAFPDGQKPGNESVRSENPLRCAREAGVEGYFDCRLREGLAGSWIVMQIVLGWLLSTIAVAGLSGLLRPRDQ